MMHETIGTGRARLVNLLDDFAIGGVIRGLGIFDCEVVRAVVTPEVLATNPQAKIAPKLDAEVIVVHFPPNWQRLMFVSSLRLRNPQAKIIWVEHSYTRAWEALKVPHRARFRAMLHMAFRLVDQVVCVSHAQARWLAEAAGLPLASIEVIYPHTSNPGLSAWNLPALVPGQLRTIGAYGRLTEAKGFDLLIAAHRQGLMPGTKLLIGGAGVDEAKLHNMAQGAGDIAFAGLVRNVTGFIDAVDVVAVPSRWEAYGQVANEAREGGRPIIVAPYDGLPEQVGEAGLIVDFADAAAVSECFAKLRAADLRAMAHNARAATQDCGPARQRQWAHLLDRLLTGKMWSGRLLDSRTATGSSLSLVA